MKILHGMFCPGWKIDVGCFGRGCQINGMGCFDLGCFVIHSDHCSNVIMNRIFKIILQIIRFPLLEKRIDYDVI